MQVWNAIGLAGEAGEVAEHIKKGVFHQHGIDREKLAKELGDVLWYAAALCTKSGLDMGEVMQANVDKLRKRYPNGYSSEDSKRRVDVDRESIVTFSGVPVDVEPETIGALDALAHAMQGHFAGDDKQANAPAIPETPFVGLRAHVDTALNNLLHAMAIVETMDVDPNISILLGMQIGSMQRLQSLISRAE